MTKLGRFRQISVKLGHAISIQQSILYLYNQCKSFVRNYLLWSFVCIIILLYYFNVKW